MRKPIVALIYDFDGTLSPGNMQEFGFIQAVGSTPEDFWTRSDGIAVGQDASNVLAYMKLMFDEAKLHDIKLRKKDFLKFGQHIQLYDGVREWFSLVNEYGAAHGVRIEHYINSSGLKEIIEGSPIAGEFKHIFAGTFIYDKNGEAEWPGIAVDQYNSPARNISYDYRTIMTRKSQRRLSARYIESRSSMLSME